MTEKVTLRRIDGGQPEEQVLELDVQPFGAGTLLVSPEHVIRCAIEGDAPKGLGSVEFDLQVGDRCYRRCSLAEMGVRTTLDYMEVD